MSEATPAIRARGLFRSFDGGRIRALRGADLTVAPGEMVALMGPSGCGKSTLLHILTAMDSPDAGEVEVDGQDVRALVDADRFRAETIGFIFQLHNLIPTLTALENVMLPMLGACTTTQEPTGRARELLAAVGLGERLDALPVTMSGGERQRVAVARAFVNRPPVIVADEPTGSLDSAAGEQVLALIDTIRKEGGASVLIVTHDARVAARADRVLRMLDGCISPATDTPPDSQLSGGEG